jgi:hypothetical protein
MASINKIREIFVVSYGKYPAIFQAPRFVQKSVLRTKMRKNKSFNTKPVSGFYINHTQAEGVICALSTALLPLSRFVPIRQPM